MIRVAASRFACSCVLAGGIAVGALGTLATPATAQRSSDMRDESPRWIAVKSDATPLRCGDRERYYAVAELDAGTLLVADGSSDQWIRVRYPESVHPFVPSDDARVIDARTIELTEASGLRSPSLIMGPAGSWRSAIDPPLPSGTRLQVAKPATDDAGATVGWYVVAPGEELGTFARGFIKNAGVRNATAAEVEAFLARGDQPAQPEPEQPETTVAQEDTDDQATPDDDATDVAADTSLLEPMTPEGEPEQQTAAADPAVDAVESTTDDASDAVLDIVAKVPASDAEAAPDDTAQAAAPETIAQGGLNEGDDPTDPETLKLTPAALRDLELTFDNARTLPREELDVALDELLAEYKRARDATDEPVVVNAIDRRIEWLELRIETRDQRRKLEGVLSEVGQREAMLAERVSTWRESRMFSIVGRVLPSRVYDGVRLPLMYRIESVDALTGGRTIGYIRPRQPDELAQRIGQVIGIRGTTAFDDQLRMNIIDPAEIEALPNP
ncbi:MAG: hypothetical protein RIB60_03255 [Phycisphaerales bacterium]